MKKKVGKKKLPVKKLVAKKAIKKVPKAKAPEKITHTISTGYLGGLFGSNFSKNVNEAVKVIKKFRKKNYFDAIAFTGTSGAGMAFPLSYLMKVPMIHIPKAGVSRHDYAKVEGTLSSKKYLIVDDFIAIGTTLRTIEKTITSELKGMAVPVGIFLYQGDKSRNRTNFVLGKHTVPIITLPIPASYSAANYIA